VPELIEKADSIVIGKISVSERIGSDFRVVVQINEYLGESPNRNYVIVGDSEGMRFRPYVGDAVLLLLSKQGDTFKVLNYGSGMFNINDESSKYPEISELLGQEFTPFKGSGLSVTGYCISSGLCLIALFPLIYMKNRKYI
jgi:hypothetical protein